ncbi:class I SAM-dependent methyltransferase [Empedobacter tilapiae]|uniref:Class I SAM-dependent methyltransferase n=1 Tax=Empedobacter tilapiae TaxID=2491114 RepID=A0A4Z1B893_9FLAO|nr:class I SAM-dependent methyltransferase [Empedobacter tilapiae]TGN23637.1 class I SAM-dependent methyltransferase [Empedobacter tilapiae]
MKNNIDLQSLAEQLSCPNGDEGIEVGEQMSESNFGMTKMTIDHLQLQNQEQILELGHGNCKHLPYVLNQAKSLEYIGLELSQVMKNSAIMNNSDYLNANIRFEIIMDERIHFYEKRFDKIFTVNTIYFWKNPKLFLSEIYRVLKFEGKFALAFAKKEFMQTLPFTQFGFNLYTEDEVIKLLKSAKFSIEDTKTFSESVISKAGEKVEREYSIIIAKK